MDAHKAQRLLLKIQSFLSNDSGQELSRLEKDLLKTYILQLYEAVHDEAQATPPVVKSTKPESHVVVEVPPVHKPEPPKIEIVPPAIPEIKATKPVEPKVEMREIEKETIVAAPKMEPKPIHIPVQEPVRETIVTRVSSPVTKTEGAEETLRKLFEASPSEDIAERFSRIPIESIESAMGLNERIFTLNTLFGGDKTLFDATCQQLNNLHSFAEARDLLLHGVARQFHWAETEKLKMAEQFIRIVSRRYPKS